MSTGLHGQLHIPGDKSISHRSVMFASLAQGTSHIHGFLSGADCLSTISCFQSMGIHIDKKDDYVEVTGLGLHGLRAPSKVLDCGNSGTTTRLISGILSAQGFDTTLTGDASICKRPMGRIIKPLSLMGAEIRSIHDNDCAPLYIHGTELKGITYDSPVASAQVKSSILLAGLYASGSTTVNEPYLSRNHTELMLKSFGADIVSEGVSATVKKADQLFACDITIPGDISSAAFFIAAAIMVPGSDIIIQHVGINPTRDGILKVAHDMGASIEIVHEYQESGEPAADIRVQSSKLHATTIKGDIIPTLIDEIPVIAAMACMAEGTTVIADAAELKVKESNRIKVMVDELTKLGAHIKETPDGMIIEGGYPLHGATIDSKKDHRIAMTFAVLNLCSDGDIHILDKDCVDISYPNFYSDLDSLL